MTENIEALKLKLSQKDDQLNRAAHQLVQAKQLINQQHELVLGMTTVALVLLHSSQRPFVVIPKSLVAEYQAKVSTMKVRIDVQDEPTTQCLVLCIVEGDNQEAIVGGSNE